MPGKTPHTNGNDPVENGINSAEDVEMKDDAPNPLKAGKGKKAKEGEEEMTVVVPPSKGSKLSGPPPKDNEGDVAMDGSEEENGVDAGAPKVDPVAQAISGTYMRMIVSASITALILFLGWQISRATFRYWNAPWPFLMPDSLSAPSALSRQSAND
jgi:hypothetical protein